MATFHVIGSSIVKWQEWYLPDNFTVESYPGAKITDIDTKMRPRIAADVVFIHVGGNDLSAGVSVISCLQSYKQLISQIRANNPGISVIISSILPRQECQLPPKGDEPLQIPLDVYMKRCHGLNWHLRCIQDLSEFSYVSVMEHRFSSRWLQADGVHLNDVGNQALADAIFNRAELINAYESFASDPILKEEDFPRLPGKIQHTTPTTTAVPFNVVVKFCTPAPVSKRKTEMARTRMANRKIRPSHRAAARETKKKGVPDRASVNRRTSPSHKATARETTRAVPGLAPLGTFNRFAHLDVQEQPESDGTTAPSRRRKRNGSRRHSKQTNSPNTVVSPILLRNSFDKLLTEGTCIVKEMRRQLTTINPQGKSSEFVKIRQTGGGPKRKTSHVPRKTRKIDHLRPSRDSIDSATIQKVFCKYSQAICNSKSWRDNNSIWYTMVVELGLGPSLQQRRWLYDVWKKGTVSSALELSNRFVVGGLPESKGDIGGASENKGQHVGGLSESKGDIGGPSENKGQHVGGMSESKGDVGGAFENKGQHVGGLSESIGDIGGASENKGQHVRGLSESEGDIGGASENKGQHVGGLSDSKGDIRGSSENKGQHVGGMSESKGDIRGASENKGQHVGGLSKSKGDIGGASENKGQHVGGLPESIGDIGGASENKGQHVGGLSESEGDIGGASENKGQHVGGLSESKGDIGGASENRGQHVGGLPESKGDIGGASENRGQHVGGLPESKGDIGGASENRGQHVGGLPESKGDIGGASENRGQHVGGLPESKGDIGGASENRGQHVGGLPESKGNIGGASENKGQQVGGLSEYKGDRDGNAEKIERVGGKPFGSKGQYLSGPSTIKVGEATEKIEIDKTGRVRQELFGEKGEGVGGPRDHKDNTAEKGDYSDPALSDQGDWRRTPINKSKKDRLVGRDVVKIRRRVTLARRLVKQTKNQKGLFCTCHKPDDNQSYVGCDECEDWYHPACVGISAEEIDLLDEYFCPECTDIFISQTKQSESTSSETNVKNETPLDQSPESAKSTSPTPSTSSTGFETDTSTVAETAPDEVSEDLTEVDKLKHFDISKLDERVSDSFEMRISFDNWTKIHKHEKQNRLCGDWTNVFCDMFKRHNPFCVLKFTYNRIKLIKSRKMNSPFFIAKAVCKHEDCAKYNFEIYSAPIPEQDLLITVNKLGTIKHERGIKRKRQLTGIKRREAAIDASRIGGASNLFYQKLASIAEETYKGGNITDAPYRYIFEKVHSLEKKVNFLAHDVVNDLASVQKFFISHHDENKKIQGYIQGISHMPFTVYLWTENQIRIVCNLIRSGKARFYFDATGGVIRKIKGQDKRTMYYAIVIKGIRTEDSHDVHPPLPVAEMITSEQTMASIARFLHTFKHNLRIMNAGQTRPQHIETDFSWPLIHGCLNVFNLCSIIDYLRKCWIIVNGNSSTNEPSLMILHLCAAHMIKLIKDKVAKLTKDKKLKEMCLYCFALLQNATTLPHIYNIFNSLVIVFSSSTQTKQCLDTITNLESLLKNQKGDADEYINIDPKSFFESGEDIPEGKSIKLSSPFTMAFDKSKIDVDEDDDLEINIYFCPQFLDILEQYIPLMPLWTGLMLGDLERHRETPPEHSTETRETNALAENWFNITKNSILIKKRHLVPGEFIRTMHSALCGRIKHYELKADDVVEGEESNETEEAPTELEEEKWSKRRDTGKKGAKYYQPITKLPVPQLSKPKKEKSKKHSHKKPNVRDNLKDYSKPMQLREHLNGLLNTHSNCWLNSSLQALKTMIAEIPPSGILDNMTQHVLEIIAKLNEARSSHKNHDPETLLEEVVTQVYSDLAGVDLQRDPCEFILYILKDLMSNSVTDQFTIQTRLQCNTCNGVRYTEPTLFPILSVEISPMPDQSVQTCVLEYFKEQVIETMIHCKICKKPKRHSSRECISTFPHLLIIQLKRFTASLRLATQMRIRRNSQHVIPNRQIQLENEEVFCVYELQAVQRHYGSINAGHYTTEVIDNANCIYYDDITIKSNPVEKRLISRTVQTDCYFLHYKRTDEKSQNENTMLSDEPIYVETNPKLIFSEYNFFEETLEWEDESLSDLPHPYNVLGNTVTVEDLVCLQNNNDLNDCVINTYLAILSNKFKCYSLSSYLGTTWMNNKFDKWLHPDVDFENYDYIFIPFLANATLKADKSYHGHWVLITIYPRTKTIAIADSLPSSEDRLNRKIFDYCMQYINERNKKRHVKDEARWNLQIPEINRQTDSHSCGVFMLMAAESLCLNVSTDCLEANDIPTCREYIRKTILMNVSRHDSRHDSSSSDEAEIIGLTIVDSSFVDDNFETLIDYLKEIIETSDKPSIENKNKRCAKSVKPDLIHRMEDGFGFKTMRLALQLKLTLKLSDKFVSTTKKVIGISAQLRYAPPNGQLFQRSENNNQFASDFIAHVLLPESIIYLRMLKTDCTYAEAETEVLKEAELFRKQNRYLD